MRTRAATLADAAAVAAIYNEGIADRIATFETEPRSAGQTGEWFTGQDWRDGYPNVWLIVSVDQAALGRDVPKLVDIPAVVHGVSRRVGTSRRRAATAAQIVDEKSDYGPVP